MGVEPLMGEGRRHSPKGQMTDCPVLLSSPPLPLFLSFFPTQNNRDSINKRDAFLSSEVARKSSQPCGSDFDIPNS